MASHKQNKGASNEELVDHRDHISYGRCFQKPWSLAQTLATTSLLIAEIPHKAGQFALCGGKAYSCNVNDRDEHLFLIKVVRRVHIYFLWNIKVTDVTSGEGGACARNGNDTAELDEKKNKTHKKHKECLLNSEDKTQNVNILEHPTHQPTHPETGLQRCSSSLQSLPNPLKDHGSKK